MAVTICPLPPMPRSEPGLGTKLPALIYFSMSLQELLEEGVVRKEGHMKGMDHVYSH